MKKEYSSPSIAVISFEDELMGDIIVASNEKNVKVVGMVGSWDDGTIVQ